MGILKKIHASNRGQFPSDTLNQTIKDIEISGNVDNGSIQVDKWLVIVIHIPVQLLTLPRGSRLWGYCRTNTIERDKVRPIEAKIDNFLLISKMERHLNDGLEIMYNQLTGRY